MATKKVTDADRKRTVEDRKQADEEFSRRRFIDDGLEFIDFTPADEVKKSESGDHVGDRHPSSDLGPK